MTRHPAPQLPAVGFRVHIEGEQPFDVEAASTEIARKKALDARPGAIITKIKRIKG